MDKLDEVIKYLEERKQYNEKQGKYCHSGEDEFCIEVVKAVRKGHENEVKRN